MRAVFCIVSLGLALVAGCGRDLPERTDPTKVVHEPLHPPRGGALFVLMHGGEDDMRIVLFSSGGTPLCELPRDTHCVVPLAPGTTHLYARWNDEMVDRWDVEAAPGLTYYATMVWAQGFVDRKLTPSSDTWMHLDEYMQSEERRASPADIARLRSELGDTAALMHDADARMEHYDERGREAHTLHADDGT